MNTGLAAQLWRKGLNTAQIASALNVREHVVYNALSSIRFIADINKMQEQAQ